MKERDFETVQGASISVGVLWLFFFFWSGVAFPTGTGTPPAEAEIVSSKMLTFADRVAYQYAIEEVYWRHRIWPRENPAPKPPLEAVISRQQIEQKVESYLRKSQLVADEQGQAITANELQAEMGRMPRDTKQADMLRELFAALGNDPFIIAECLARPILAERFVSEAAWKAEDTSFRAERRNPAEASRADAMGPFDFAQDDIPARGNTPIYSLPEISVSVGCANDTWTPTATINVPAARSTRTTVWTGSEMIIWGGANSNGALNTGGRYDPATDSWMATSMTNAPTARGSQSSVWTGTELIIWGGFTGTADLNTGGKYNPISDSWTATSSSNAPAPRDSHTAVWTGGEMIVWGGDGCGGNCRWNTGGRYNPSTDSWTATSTMNAPIPRFGHTAAWNGDAMIVWGGSDSTNYLHTGGKYDPRNDSWTPTGLMNAASGRVHHTVVWTGSEMIVWGGVDKTFNDTNTGGRYNPSTDSWIATSLNNAPSPRDSQTAVWTGAEMVIWAGIFNTTNLNTGGRYDASTDSWTATSITNAPLARYDHTAIWTGSEMIAWGGFHYPSPYLNTGGIYCAQPSTPIVQSAVSRKTHGNVSSFDVDLPLSGTPGIECRSGGATNDYTIVVAFLANVSVNGNPQAAVTSGTGTIGSGGIGNDGMVITSGNVVTIPLTNVANAQTINVTLYGVNGSTNFVVPMSVLVGDTNSNGAVNASDVVQTKSRIGQQINATNFRSDVNANDGINASDVSLTKSAVGTGLP